MADSEFYFSLKEIDNGKMKDASRIVWYYDCMAEFFFAYYDNGDTELYGRGLTADEAIQNLKEMTGVQD